MGKNKTDIEDIAIFVTRIISEEFGISAAELASDTDLSSILGADSVKVLRAVARIEKQYGVELEDEQVFSAATIDDITSAMESLLKVQEARGEQ
jgi:acyl carrier protein